MLGQLAACRRFTQIRHCTGPTANDVSRNAHKMKNEWVVARGVGNCFGHKTRLSYSSVHCALDTILNSLRYTAVVQCCSVSYLSK